MLATASAKAIIFQPRSVVWEKLSDFGNLDWAVGFGIQEFTSEGSGVGMYRYPILSNGEKVTEKLIRLEPKEFLIEYQIIGGNLIESLNYLARVWIEDGEECSHIHWLCEAEFPDDKVESKKSELNLMVQGMAQIFSSQF